MGNAIDSGILFEDFNLNKPGFGEVQGWSTLQRNLPLFINQKGKC
jgi:hypothetical protein